MNKKLIRGIITICIVASMCIASTACSIKIGNIDDSSKETQIEQSSQTTTVETKAANESDVSALESSKSETSSGNNSNSRVIKATDTSEDNPASLGEWVQYTVLNYSTMSLFNAEMRITKITTESDDSAYVKDSVEEYNKKNIFQFDTEKMSKKTEFVVADIEMRIPDTESVKDYKGFPRPLSFDIDKPSDVPYKDTDGDTMIFTTSVGDFYGDDKTFSTGDTCKTKIIYAMVKEFDNYFIKITENINADNYDCDYGYLSAKAD